jgi:hypothetical protein
VTFSHGATLQPVEVEVNECPRRSGCKLKVISWISRWLWSSSDRQFSRKGVKTYRHLTDIKMCLQLANPSIFPFIVQVNYAAFNFVSLYHPRCDVGGSGTSAYYIVYSKHLFPPHWISEARVRQNNMIYRCENYKILEYVPICFRVNWECNTSWKPGEILKYQVSEIATLWWILRRANNHGDIKVPCLLLTFALPSRA